MATVVGTLKFFHTEGMNRRLLVNHRMTKKSNVLADFQLSLLDDIEQQLQIIPSNTVTMITSTQPIKIVLTNDSGTISLVTDTLVFPTNLTSIVVQRWESVNSNLHLIQS